MKDTVQTITIFFLCSICWFHSSGGSAGRPQSRGCFLVAVAVVAVATMQSFKTQKIIFLFDQRNWKRVFCSPKNVGRISVSFPSFLCLYIIPEAYVVSRYGPWYGESKNPMQAENQEEGPGTQSVEKIMDREKVEEKDDFNLCVKSETDP